MELTQGQLAQLKQVETEMLRSFIRVCDQLHLNYYVLGGTLLGAVRHQGFIPWDDDIDVGMPRRDYEIFLARGQALLPPEIFLQTHETDPAYPLNFAKLRRSGTTFVERSLKNCPIHHGVYIDVFPLDYYPDAGQRLFHIRKTLMYLRTTDAFCISGMKGRTKLARLLSRVLYPTVRDAVLKREALFQSVTGGRFLVNHCGAWGKKEIIPAHWYGDGVELTFEGIPVRAPRDWHQWLTQVYGNYMELPPPSQRIPHHHVTAFDLGT